MISPQTIDINGVRYIQAKEAEINFWVSFFGIAAGIIFGFLLLRTFFQATLSEQILIQNEPQEQQIMYEGPIELEAVPEGITV